MNNASLLQQGGLGITSWTVKIFLKSWLSRVTQMRKPQLYTWISTKVGFVCRKSCSTKWQWWCLQVHVHFTNDFASYADRTTLSFVFWLIHGGYLPILSALNCDGVVWMRDLRPGTIVPMGAYCFYCVRMYVCTYVRVRLKFLVKVLYWFKLYLMPSKHFRWTV